MSLVKQVDIEKGEYITLVRNRDFKFEVSGYVSGDTRNIQEYLTLSNVSPTVISNLENEIDLLQKKWAANQVKVKKYNLKDFDEYRVEKNPYRSSLNKSKI